MQRVNIAAPTFEFDADDPDGFRCGLFRFGQQLGAVRSGTSVYEVPPGQTICPYHYEYGEEEWLLVLDGRPTLRHHEGEDVLEPWDVVFFPSGPEGGHAVRNDTATTVRLLMYSTVTTPAVVVYPDSDKMGIFTGNREDDRFLRHSAGLEYFDGEPGVAGPS